MLKNVMSKSQVYVPEKIKTTFALQFIDFIEVNFSYYGHGILQSPGPIFLSCF